MKRFTLTKNERLHKRNFIKHLFSEGNSFAVYPFKVVWAKQEFEGSNPAQFAISVSKRNFRRAVKRNHIKRLCREGYRLNKHRLYEALNKSDSSLVFMLIYIGKDLPEFHQVEKKIIIILRRLSKVDEKAAE